MVQKIQVRRGLKNNLPILSSGEIGFTTDTNETFIGSPNGNIKVNVSQLSDLTDLDVSNRTNGYAIQFDSTSGKFKSMPLPTGSGSVATNLDGLTDVDVTTVLPSEGNILTYNGGIWKPESPNTSSNSTNVYVIEILRWGITQGFPTKPYTTTNYTTAYNNISGINNAFTWAYNNNYDYVVLPKGTYALCYPQSINTQPNTTYDFNGSTLKVMYESNVRQPYDTSTTNSTYRFYGTSIMCRTQNTHIINLKLIGDRIERSWTVTDERNAENSVGIQFAAGATNSSARYCDVSYYMGDSFWISFSPYNSFSVGTTEMGDIDDSGNPKTSTTGLTVRNSTFVTLPTGLKSLAMIGLGFAPATSIPSSTYNVYFYKSDGTFLYRKTNVRTRDTVQVGLNAEKIKLTWEGKGTADDGCLPGNPPYWSILVNGSLPDNITIEYNEIHRCHRGGLFLGGNNALIRKNYFHDTGSPDGMDIDGLPQFPDFTRYAINTEDNVGQNCKIIDNVFDNSRIAIALRGEYNEITGNEMRNCPVAIQLYYQRHCIVSKNFIYYGTFGCFNYYNFDRDWIINENIFYGSSLNLSGSGTITSINSNRFYNKSVVSLYLRALSFKNNTFDNSTYSVNEYQTIVEGCSFINNSAITLYSYTGVYDKIIRCNFASGGNAFMQNSNQMIIQDSTFTDGLLRYGSQTGTFTLNNCKFNNVTYPVIKNDVPNGLGSLSIVLEIKNNSSISLGYAPSTWVASKSYAISANGKLDDRVIPTTPNGYYYECTASGITGSTQPTWVTTEGATVTDGTVTWTAHAIVKCPIIYGYNWGKVIIQDSTVNFNVVGNYTNAVLDNYGSIKDSVHIKNSTITASPGTTSNSLSSCQEVVMSSTNIFTNFSLTNSIVEIQSDMMNAEPTAGIFKLGQQVMNANPTAGGYLGWVCLTSGTANNISWASYHDYALGSKIYSGSNVYQVIVAGKSAGASPLFTNILNATVTDNAGITTGWTASHAYALGDIVIPSVLNGYWYQCASPGTSGTSEPVWHIDGSNTVEGVIVWNFRKFVTWQNISTKATFKPFGTISQ